MEITPTSSVGDRSGSTDNGSGDAARALQSDDHLRVLPASANWYCSKVCDWICSEAYGVLFAFGAKDSVFLYQLALDGDSASSSSNSDASTSNDVKQSSWRSRHVPTSDSSAPRFVAHLRRGRKDQRMTALQFLQDRSGELRLVCGGEDGSVQVWDVATLALVAQQRKHSGVEVMAVTASSVLDPLLVVAGDRQGRISVWKRDEDSVALFTPVAGDCVFAMAMAPHDKAVVAVGYRSGVLCIVDVSQRSIRHRLEGHDQEVQSVVWRVPTNSTASDDASAVALLASSSRDRSIKVWRVVPTEEPYLEQQLTLPKAKQASSYSQSKRLWLPIAWSSELSSQDARRLWSGSFDGNLLAWEWPAPTAIASASVGTKKPPACKPVVVKNGHNRLLFNIVSLPWRSEHAASVPSLLTMSLDREVRLWHESASAAALQCRTTLVGLGGHVYSVAFNASTEVVAAGVGDQTIRLWHVAPQRKSAYDVELLWKGLQSKVTCVAWSPFERAVLAFGTDDGHIGIVDVEAKKSVRFRTSHASAVQSLQWRVHPSLSSSPSQTAAAVGSDVLESDNASSFVQAMLALESAQADGQRLEDALHAQESISVDTNAGSAQQQLQLRLWSQDTKQHVLESDPDRPTAASTAIELACSGFAWTARGDQLAIARASGAVEILMATADGLAGSVATPSAAVAGLVVAFAYHEHEQRAACLSWRTDGEALASGSQDGKIVVWCRSEQQHRSNSTATVALTGHSSAITSLRWSASSADALTAVSHATPSPLLASSSLDGTVQVWDTQRSTCVSCFHHHIGRVLSVDWIDAYTLVSGGDDQTIRIWDYRVQRDKRAVNVKPTATAAGKALAAKSVVAIAAAPSGKAGDAAAHDASASSAASATKKTVGGKTKRKAKSSVFHTDAPAAVDVSVRRCRELLGASATASSDGDGNAVEDFEDQALRFTDQFAVEEHAYASEQDWEHLAQVYLLQGKVADALRVVANEGAMTASWLALAPMAGVDVWRELTNVYAQQLDTRGDKTSAALHYLSIGKTRAAVRALASGHAYAEALALAQSRLGARDPLVSSTLLAHSAYLEKHQRFGEAAQTLLAVGTAAARARAVVALVKTRDVHALATAVDVLQSLARCSAGSAVAAGAGESRREHMTPDSDWSVPSTTVHEIVSGSLCAGDFALAARASAFLGTGASALRAPASTATRVTRCFLGVAAELARYGFPVAEMDPLTSAEFAATVTAVTDDGGSEPAPAQWLPADVPDDARAFFTYLVQHSQHSYSDELWSQSSRSTLASRQAHSKRFWHALLVQCRMHGFWFGDATEDDVVAAQELLMDEHYFAGLLHASPASLTDAGASSGSSQLSSSSSSAAAAAKTVRVAHCVLQLLLDVVCGYLLSALERLRDAFEAATSKSNDSAAAQLSLTMLVFPSGFIDPQAPPRIGELAVEVDDARAFWRSCRLYQCTAAAAGAETRGDEALK